MRISGTRRMTRRIMTVAGLAACAWVGSTMVAQAATVTSTPGWEVTPFVSPSSLAPGQTGYIVLSIYNVGGAGSSGPVTVTDKLPAGVTASEVGYVNEPFVNSVLEGGLGPGEQWNCTLGSVVTCTNNESALPSIPPGEAEFLAIAVNVPADASGVAMNEVTVSGGGARTPANMTSTLSFGGETSTFGFQGIDGWFSNADGTLDTQAGSHPYSLTFELGLKNNGELPAGTVRDVQVNLPRGLVGNPTSVPQCPTAQLNAGLCPADSQIGVDQVYFGVAPVGPHPIEEKINNFMNFIQLPVYNMVPPPGVPAQFAFNFFGEGTKLNARVRTGGDYGISEIVDNILQRNISGNWITVWGVPEDPSHDFQRQAINRVSKEEEYDLKSHIAEAPFLTLPTACEGPQTFTASADAWPSEGIEAPIGEASFQTHENSGLAAGITGCDHLTFNPTISVAPDTSDAETPAGLTVEVKTPQEGLTSVEGLAASNIKDTTVTLPEGVVINPGQAHGLQTCSQAQSALGTEEEPSCPNASKVGSDEIETPLLFHSLKGNVYVLDSNPPNLKLLVAASGEGVNLKLVGDVHLDESTGRLTTTFSETPELPFTTFKLSFSGGAQAALYTPPRCGAYRTSSDFTPWTTPSVADAFPSSEFAVSAGADGGPCPSGELPFAPTLTAGATTDQAGGFTDFSMLLTRPDGQQRIDGLQFKAPPGLTGRLAGVPLCTNAQAEANSCPEASQIGHTSVEAGPGSYPLVVPEPGQPQAPIYLTEGYEGAPFGLSIVVPLHVGPFVLPTQRVRAKIEVDPNTAQLTVTTDPLPQVVAGVPTDLRAVDAVVDRADFMINPTNCEPQEFSGTAYGAPPAGAGGPGANASIGTRFQVGSCQALKFAPKFSISTNGKTSKAGGASLNVKLSFPNLPQGSQANVRTVKVDLPKQLPSRLTTLQKACTEAQFNTNPAGCPAASVIGHAVAHTPILPVPLTGPAYFVSHGGAKFPELIMVLQGYGLTIMLHGETFINKAGITSSTFHAVPDQPVSSFELVLPQGYNSALAANGNLCTSKLSMPTEFVGQNGAFLEQNTKVTVTGCPKTKTLTRTQKLALALKACHKKHNKTKRTACEHAAHKKYAPTKQKAKKK